MSQSQQDKEKKKKKLQSILEAEIMRIMHIIYGAGKMMVETFGMTETVEKADQIYKPTARLPRINTIRDDQMVELAECFGVNHKELLN